MPKTIALYDPRRPRAASASTRTLRAFGIGLVAWVALAPLAAVRADDLQDVSKLVAGNKLDDAEKRADAFLAKTPKDAQMRFLKGVILSQRGKRDEAVAQFTGITQDYPELPEPYNNLAVIYAAQGRYDNARSALETAIRVSPNYATAYENLGDVYAALAARAYQDARRNDGNNAAALRKLDAARALLTTTRGPAVAAVPATVAAAPVAPVEVVRSQRDVGLPSPAGPRVSVGGSGAVAPEIVVPADAATVPQGSNVVAIEAAPSFQERTETTTLAGAKTVVGGDPAAPGNEVDAVGAAVKRWAQSRSMTTDDLRIRVDGDTAVARFRAALQDGRKKTLSNRALTLRRNGAAWTVVDDRTES